MTSDPMNAPRLGIASEPEEALDQGPDPAPVVSDPSELLRIGNMVGSLLEEAHLLTMDEAGRHRLAEVHQRAVDAVRAVVSEQLQGELIDLGLTIDDADSSESVLRLAQAQFVGWLNGLLLGLQAAAATQARLQALGDGDGDGRSGAASRPRPRPRMGGYA